VIIVPALTLHPAAILLRVLHVLDAVSFTVLAIMLVRVNRHAGTLGPGEWCGWSTRCPSVAGAYVFGAIATIVWRAPLGALGRRGLRQHRGDRVRGDLVAPVVAGIEIALIAAGRRVLPSPNSSPR
jgi:hypothetical protein